MKNIIKNLTNAVKQAFDIEDTTNNIASSPLDPQILIFTGAGLSEESGLPTFRTGENGLWNNHNLDEVCNAQTFLKNKEKVFQFYNERKLQYSNVKPNKAHYAIADIQKKYGIDNVKLYTSNIDNLMEDAGCVDVQHVHGHINSMNCLSCHHQWDIGAEEFIANTHCPHCNLYKKTKPGVIFFNEKAPMYSQFFSEFSKGSIYKNGEFIPVIKIVIGSSLKVITENHLQTDRGISILLDPYPSATAKFTYTVAKKATEGIDELNSLLDKIYI